MSALPSTWGKKWDYHLNVADVFHDDALTLEAKQDVIVGRIRSAPWFDEGDDDLCCIVEELAEATDVAWFDKAWSALYDWCDAGKRVWIATSC